MTIIKSTTASVGQKRPRTVCFNTTVKYVLDTRRNLEDGPTSDSSTWYAVSDMTAIKTSIRCDLQNLSAGRLPFRETDQVSWRGLEIYTHKKKKDNKFHRHRRERRAFLNKGIQDLQKRLGVEGLPTDAALRKLSMISSKPAVQEAQRLAQEDAKAANQIYLEQFLVPTSNNSRKEEKKMELTDVSVVANDGLPPVIQQQPMTARTA